MKVVPVKVQNEDKAVSELADWLRLNHDNYNDIKAIVLREKVSGGYSWQVYYE